MVKIFQDSMLRSMRIFLLLFKNKEIKMQSCFVLIWGCPWLFDEEIKLFVQNTRVSSQSQYIPILNDERNHAAICLIDCLSHE